METPLERIKRLKAEADARIAEAKQRMEESKKSMKEMQQKAEEDRIKMEEDHKKAEEEQASQPNANFDANAYMEQMNKAWSSAGIDMNEIMKQGMAQMGNMQNMGEMLSGQMEETMKDLFGASAEDLINSDGAIAHFADSMADLMNPDSTLSTYEQWAISFNSNLAYENGYFANDITVGYPVDAMIEGLENAWGIKNKKDLIDKLDYLTIEGGHTKYATDLWEILTKNKRPKWRTEIESLQLNYMSRDIEIELDYLIDYANHLIGGYTTLRQANIIKEECTPNITAWDVQRAVFLSRAGFDLEWFTKSEALEHITKFAEIARETYTSWEEYSYSFLMGFYMWSGSDENLEIRSESHRELLTNEKSPWMILPFDTPST